MNLISSSLALFLSLIVSWPVFAQDGCPTTNIVLPLRISTKALQDTLNRDIPSQMSGREDIDLSGVKGEHVWWSMSRSPINLSTSDNRLRAKTTISGKVRVRGKVRPFGPDFSVGPNLTIGANLSIRPVLESDWHLRPNIKASARVTSARINTPVGSISVRTQSQRAVDKLMRRTVDRINEKFERNESLRREGQELWKDLHRPPKKLSDEPPVWLVMRPTQIGATNLSINDDSVNFGISVGAETKIVFGPPPTQEEFPSQDELPLLKISDKLLEEKTETELALAIFSDWETLNDLITDSLTKNPIVHKGSSGRLTLTNIRLAAGPKKSLLVSAAISVEPTRWINRVLLFFHLTEVLDNQIVEMSVEPDVSEDGRSVVLKNPKLRGNSNDLVETLTDTYSWLTGETIRAVIERHAVADLRTRLVELEQKDQAISNKITEKLGESISSLSVEIRPETTRLSFVEVGQEGLGAKVCATADIEAEFRSLEF